MKVTRHEDSKPVNTEQSASNIVKNAEEKGSDTDARGRVIVARRLNALQYYRLAKAMGASASNEQAMEMAAIACAVCSIDGKAVDFPNTEAQVEFLIQLLDFDGIAAAVAALGKIGGDESDSVQTAKN